jgi:hypothetical protein
MLADMLQYNISMLDAIVDFLSTPPIVYLFGFGLFGYVISLIIKMIKN